MQNGQETYTNTATSNESCIGLSQPFGLTKHVEEYSKATSTNQFARHTDGQQTLHEPNGSIKQQLKIPRWWAYEGPKHVGWEKIYEIKTKTKSHLLETLIVTWVRIFQSQQCHIPWDNLHIYYRKQLVELSFSLRHDSCCVNRACWVELLRGMWRHRLTSRITSPFRVCDLEVTGSSSWWMCRNTSGFVFRVCTYYAETLWCSSRDERNFQIRYYLMFVDPCIIV
jgi:hypothetical protein